MKRLGIRDYVLWGLLGFCIVCIVASFSIARTPGDTDNAARHVERSVGRRMAILNTFIDRALASDRGQWMDLQGLPEDMVVYRYVNDTLQSWANQFTVTNDDISSRLLYQRLGNPRTGIVSPLQAVTDSVSFMNMGARWYLVKSAEDGNCKVIAGLEVMNSADDRSLNGVNRRMHLGDKFSVKPLSFSGGTAVLYHDRPMFKVLYDSLTGPVRANSQMVWFAFVLLLVIMLLYLSFERTMTRFWVVLAGILLSTTLMYLWGRGMRDETGIFSPTLYADGGFLYSLGAVIIVNIAIMMMICSTYLMRKELLRWLIKDDDCRNRMVGVAVALMMAMAVVIALSAYMFRSIIMNSGITLELYKISELSRYTALVYVSFITVLMTIPLMLQMLRPVLKDWFGISFDALSAANRIVFAALLSVFLVLISSELGFRKEQSRVEVWANRLSMDRDISLELLLRSSEPAISSDLLISSLSVLDNINATIQNRISENYLYRISQDYDISVYIINENSNTPEMSAFFSERIRAGQPIADNSHFVYDYSTNGHARYSAIFSYFTEHGVTHMLLCVESKANKEDRGYSRLLGFSDPGKVVIPARYSYARYSHNDLVTYKGTYAYPIIMTERIARQVEEGGSGHMVIDGFVHFVHETSPEEVVIISRPRYESFNYVLEVISIALLAYLAMSLLALSRQRQTMMGKNYYKSRVTTVLVLSLIATLIVMALVSVLFVYRRNDTNQKSMMSDKVSSIQALLENRYRGVRNYVELASQENTTVLETVSNITKADITLYTPSGVVLNTTSPDIFERMLIGSRINEDAYDNIIFKNKRYYINKETVAGQKYYSLNAPVFNGDGQILAIFSSPYNDESYDLGMDAVKHSVTIVAVFLILLILARFMIVTVVDRMFKPLVEMGRKMNATNIDDLEYISYDRDDEITTLVTAYNRMVTDLSESSRQLAQAERDKAWSAMARQVAHEIKNPLTPMKLQLQRIIRLKEKNAPGWQEKFDEGASIILDHIDILSSTANEFSTFAKLYTEEPTLIDLDELIKEEIGMFDNKDNIEFQYIGLPGSYVMGPKPQLTRAFVNLLTNSVQAIEILQQEQAESGEEPRKGIIFVSVRMSSSKDGCYDIVFEDNGPGVSEENQAKLFTPNFTTKSSGTGLGLAMCRSILEMSGAEIRYSKSFTLQGACFTIVFPATEKI